jgi:hypothetical protein
VLLGNAAAQHPQAGRCWRWRSGSPSRPAPAWATWAKAANSVGAQLVGALPGSGRLSAGQMLAQPMKALLLLDVEPALDAADAAAHARRWQAGLVVALTPFKDAAADMPTCCCRSRRSPRPRAASSTPRAACRASTAWSSRWARRARPGRCCACWATCWACRASIRRPARRCAPRRWATVRLAARLDNRRPAGACRRGRGAWSAWPTCRSTPATRWCAGPPRCS